jgi:hypothetical protein
MTTCRQKEWAIGVSRSVAYGSGSPAAPAKYWRSAATSETSAIGMRRTRVARRVRRSRVSSGPASSRPVRERAARRSASWTAARGAASMSASPAKTVSGNGFVPPQSPQSVADHAPRRITRAMRRYLVQQERRRGDGRPAFVHDLPPHRSHHRSTLSSSSRTTVQSSMQAPMTRVSDGAWARPYHPWHRSSKQAAPSEQTMPHPPQLFRSEATHVPSQHKPLRQAALS